MNISTIICNIAVALTQLIKLLFVVATVVFLWGVVQYIAAQGDEKKLAESRKRIIYGLIGLFVMLAVWGLVFAVYRTTFGTTNTPYVPIPSCSQAPQLPGLTQPS